MTNPFTTILLIRHGQTSYNAERRVMGRLPIELSPAGEQEARSLSEELSMYPVDSVYMSPMKRTQQTAQIVFPEHESIIEANALSEIDYGEWVGRTYDEIIGQEDRVRLFSTPTQFHAPSGETLDQVQDRVMSFVRRLIKENAGSRIALISHADCLKIIMASLMGMDLDSIHRFRIDTGSLTLMQVALPVVRLIVANRRTDLARAFEAF